MASGLRSTRIERGRVVVVDSPSRLDSFSASGLYSPRPGWAASAPCGSERMDPWIVVASSPVVRASSARISSRPCCRPAGGSAFWTISRPAAGPISITSAMPAPATPGRDRRRIGSRSEHRRTRLRRQRRRFPSRRPPLRGPERRRPVHHASRLRDRHVDRARIGSPLRRASPRLCREQQRLRRHPRRPASRGRSGGPSSRHVTLPRRSSPAKATARRSPTSMVSRRFGCGSSTSSVRGKTPPAPTPASSHVFATGC